MWCWLRGGSPQSGARMRQQRRAMPAAGRRPPLIYEIGVARRGKGRCAQAAKRASAARPCLSKNWRAWRTLIGSNTCSGSDSQTVSTSPRRGRPQPALRPLYWMPARFSGFHPNWLGRRPMSLGQPGKLGLQGGYGGCGGLGVRRRRGKRRGPWRSGGAPAGAPVTGASPAAARGHPAQLLGSLVEQERLSGHVVVSLHTTNALTRAHKQVQRGGRWQIVAMKRRWPGGLSGPRRNSAGRYRAVVGKAPKKPGFAAQSPHVTPSQGRSARMPTSAQAGTAGRCCAATAAG